MKDGVLQAYCFGEADDKMGPVVGIACPYSCFQPDFQE